jgi:hypothetical protein
LPLEVDRQADWHLITGEAADFVNGSQEMNETRTYMSFVGISNWFSPSVYRPRSVTLGLVMTDCPAARSSKSFPR